MTLSASPTFRGLPDPWLEQLRAAATRHTLDPGQPIAGDRLYLVLAGEVSVSTPPPVEILGQETAGGVLAHDEELEYRAVGPVDVLAWEQDALEELYRANAGLERQLRARLSLRTRISELVDLLRRTSLFREAAQSSVRQLVESATLTWFASGATICTEGDEADEMFLIVSGEVAFFREGLPDAVRRLQGGEFFGEIALVANTPRTATAVATTDVEVLVIGRDEFDALSRRSPTFKQALRSTAELRLESDRTTVREPDAVWIVNETDWPAEEQIVEALRAIGADFVVRDDADVAVHVTHDVTAPFPHERRPLLRVLRVVVGDRDGQPFRRDTFSPGAPERLARAIARRRVAVALGGGAAWGNAHIAFLRGLDRAGIPVDMVVGVSMGSVVGAFYASEGAAGLDRLLAAKLEVSAAALAAIGTTTSIELFVNRHIAEKRLEELPLPFAAVAVEADTAREQAFWHGSLPAAIRASCSLPGIYGRPLFGGRGRYLDACVRHNVPVRYCNEAEADFVIACDVVPPPDATRAAPRGRKQLVLDLLQVNRLTDTVRSLYWLASTSGELQAGLADVLFAPNLSEFSPWDFHRANAIVDAAEAQLDDWLDAARTRYEALAHA
jgi:predicted acylesterase/phospholipase RssA/CRP-like cAMP-binding protein